MSQRRDVTLPTLLLASMTLYGFLLVWAQSDIIELTTTSGSQKNGVQPAGFTIGTHGNVSLDLTHWYSTRMATMATTPAPNIARHVDKSPTTAADPDTATIPLPTAPSTRDSGAREPPAATGAKVPAAKTPAPATNIGTTGNANVIPRAMRGAATNSTGRVSIKVRLQSSASKDKTIEVFLKKACDFFLSLQLEDVTITLGPERTPMCCFKN